MNTRCRVEEETRDYLEDAARSQILSEMFENLDMQVCDVCDEQAPSTEFVYEGVCQACAKDSQMILASGIVEIDHEPAQ